MANNSFDSSENHTALQIPPTAHTHEPHSVSNIVQSSSYANTNSTSTTTTTSPVTTIFLSRSDVQTPPPPYPCVLPPYSPHNLPAYTPPLPPPYTTLTRSHVEREKPPNPYTAIKRALLFTYFWPVLVFIPIFAMSM